MVLQQMLAAISNFEYRYDDDLVDKLNYMYTSAFLLMSSILVSFKLFAGRPLECWAPAHFTSVWEDYAEMYCWAQNTYWLPFHLQIPEGNEERRETMVSYYQWIPFFFLIQSFLFYLPSFAWRMLNNQSGYRINDICTMGMDRSHIGKDGRREWIDSVSSHICALIRFQNEARGNGFNSKSSRKPNKNCWSTLLTIRHSNYYLTLSYLIVKLTYCINATVHLLLMNIFLSTDDYTIYGIGVIGDLLSGRPWEESGNFPRVTLCDFQVRVLGTVQEYTVQCVLAINIFNEKLFILCWILFTALTIVSFTSLLTWSNSLLRPDERIRYATKQLEIKAFRAIDKEIVGKFANEFLGGDGVFLLQTIESKLSHVYSSELTSELYRQYASMYHHHISAAELSKSSLLVAEDDDEVMIVEEKTPPIPPRRFTLVQHHRGKTATGHPAEYTTTYSSLPHSPTTKTFS